MCTIVLDPQAAIDVKGKKKRKYPKGKYQRGYAVPEQVHFRRFILLIA